MRFLPKLDKCNSSSQDCDSEASEVLGTNGEGTVAEEDRGVGESGCRCTAQESHLLKTVGWITAALGAVALGVIVGRELRQRYKFNRRTPYDLYAHSGDELSDADFFVGI
jgi:hypothetical protein